MDLGFCFQICYLENFIGVFRLFAKIHVNIIVIWTFVLDMLGSHCSGLHWLRNECIQELVNSVSSLTEVKLSIAHLYFVFWRRKQDVTAQEPCDGPLHRGWLESSKRLKREFRISSEWYHLMSEYDHLHHLLAAFEQGKISLVKIQVCSWTTHK